MDRHGSNVLNPGENALAVDLVTYGTPLDGHGSNTSRSGVDVVSCDYVYSGTPLNGIGSNISNTSIDNVFAGESGDGCSIGDPAPYEAGVVGILGMNSESPCESVTNPVAWIKNRGGTTCVNHTHKAAQAGV